MGRPSGAPTRPGSLLFAAAVTETLPSVYGSRERWKQLAEERFGSATRLGRIRQDIIDWRNAESERFPELSKVYQLIGVGAFSTEETARRFLAAWREADATRTGGRAVAERSRYTTDALEPSWQLEARVAQAFTSQRLGNLDVARREFAAIRRILSEPVKGIGRAERRVLAYEVAVGEARLYSQLGDHSAAEAFIDQLWCRLPFLADIVSDERMIHRRMTLSWRMGLAKSMLGDSKTAKRFFEAHHVLADRAGIGHQTVGAQVWGEAVPALLRGRGITRPLVAAIEKAQEYGVADPRFGHTTPGLSLVQADLLTAANAAVTVNSFEALRAVLVAARRLDVEHATLAAEGVSELLAAFDRFPTNDRLQGLRPLLQQARHLVRGSNGAATPPMLRGLPVLAPGLTRSRVTEAWEAASDVDVTPTVTPARTVADSPTASERSP